MPIEKLEEFARDGQKNTDELILTDGFPRPKFPARQWFNYLFNAISLKINELIDLDPIARSEIIDDLTTNDANKPLSAKQGKDLQDNKLDKTDLKDASTTQKGIVQLNNTLTSSATDEALTAAQAKKLNDQAFGVGQTWMNVFSSRVIGTTYTNTTGKPIMVVIWQVHDSAPILYIDDIKIAEIDGTPGSVAVSMSAVVPNGSTYRVSKSINGWVELR